VKPTLVQYEARAFGVGEVWLDEDGRVFHCELPRPRALSKLRARSEPAQSKLRASSEQAQTLGARLQAFFAGVADDFLDVPLRRPDGFDGACVDVLRPVPRGEVVT
jgi:O6-methylguanine-DNA--protein-cysteine methyltransferase